MRRDGMGDYIKVFVFLGLAMIPVPYACLRL